MIIKNTRMLETWHPHAWKSSKQKSFWAWADRKWFSQLSCRIIFSKFWESSSLLSWWPQRSAMWEAEEMHRQTEGRMQHLMDLMAWKLRCATQETAPFSASYGDCTGTSRTIQGFEKVPGKLWKLQVRRGSGIVPIRLLMFSNITWVFMQIPASLSRGCFALTWPHARESAGLVFLCRLVCHAFNLWSSLSNSSRVPNFLDLMGRFEGQVWGRVPQGGMCCPKLLLQLWRRKWWIPGTLQWSRWGRCRDTLVSDSDSYNRI